LELIDPARKRHGVGTHRVENFRRILRARWVNQEGMNTKPKATTPAPEFISNSPLAAKNQWQNQQFCDGK
jgi:hypothetical protein